ncbi:TspO/MBR family protein [Chitinophagaceae bacterium MMS25-I14]
MQPVIQPNKKKHVGYPWIEVAVLTIAVSALGFLTSGRQSRREKYYTKTLKTPPWAPPSWVFAPAWTINNIFLLKALMHLLNKDEDIPNRKKLLLMQAVIWVNFFSFGIAFFKKRSPLLGAVITQADALAAAGSFLTAYKTDKKLAAHYLPLLVWTWFADTVAIYTAAKNPDPYIKTKALLN